VLVSRRSFIGGLAVLPFAANAQSASRAQQLIASARRQVGVTVAYDPAYSRLTFPGGDVPRARGVCTDVLIRAYRDAFGVDLQALVNADMRRAFGAYPKRWGLGRPDANIDHRRVPNLQTFLSRRGVARPVSGNAVDWAPGDIFTSMIGGRLPHTGIVSDRRGAGGRPLVIHNIGRGAQEEDALFAYPLTGHYRWT
jgi:uncharacterized protein